MGDTHNDTLATMNNLTWIYSSQGRLEDAELLCRGLLAGRRIALGDEDPKTLTAINTLAVMLQNREMLEEVMPAIVSWCHLVALSLCASLSFCASLSLFV